jgi:ribosomal protein L37AE/L43A
MSDIHEGEWKRNENYVCRTCEDAAYISKFNGNLWGCKTCGFTTLSVYIYFKEIGNVKVPVQAGDRPCDPKP